MEFPYGIAFDENGDLDIADHGNDVIRRIDGNGVITTIAGTGVGGYSGDGGAAVDAQLAGHLGLLADPAGNVFVADGGNGCVRVIDERGNISSAVCA